MSIKNNYFFGFIILICILFLSGCASDPKPSYDEVDVHKYEEEKIKTQEEVEKIKEDSYVEDVENPDFRNVKWNFNKNEVQQSEKGLLLLNFKEEFKDINIDGEEFNDDILIFEDYEDNLRFEIIYSFKNNKIDKVVMVNKTENPLFDYTTLLDKYNKEYNTNKIVEEVLDFKNLNSSFKKKVNTYINTLSEESDSMLYDDIKDKQLILKTSWSKNNTKTSLVGTTHQDNVVNLIIFRKNKPN